MSDFNLPIDIVRLARDANLNISASLADCLHRRAPLPILKQESRYYRIDRLKQQLEEEEGPQSARISLDKRLTIFEETLAQTVRVLDKFCQQHGNQVLWMSFAVSNDTEAGLKDRVKPAPGDFGLRQPDFAYSAKEKVTSFVPPPSLTKSFLQWFLEKSFGEGERVTDHPCFGLAMHRNRDAKLRSPCGEFHPLRIDAKGTGFEHAVEGLTWEPQLQKRLTKWLQEFHTENPIEEYFEGYDALTGSSRIELQLSATSIFKSLEKDNQRSAAQFVCGFSKDSSAYELYHILQIILGGLPIAWNAITELHARADELAQYERAYRTMLQPLQNISKSIHSLQQDTQTLSVLLHSPTEGLFSAHPQIAELFEEGHNIALNGYLDFKPNHSGTYPLDDEDKALLGLQLIAARVFGYKLEFADHIRDAKSAHQDAVHQLSRYLEAGGPYNEKLKVLCASLRYLATDENVPDASASTNFRAYSTPKSSSLAIGRIKNALFTPFKLVQSAWHSEPLELIYRDFCKGGSSVAVHSEGDEEWLIPGGASPVPYSAILQFVIGACAAATSSSESQYLKEITRTEGDGSFRLELTFGNAHPFGENKDCADEQAALAERMYGASRAGYYRPEVVLGNFHKPFLDLVARIAPLIEQRFDGGKTTTKNGIIDPARDIRAWSTTFPDDLTKSTVFCVSNPIEGRSFEVRAFETIELIWSPERILS